MYICDIYGPEIEFLYKKGTTQLSFKDFLSNNEETKDFAEKYVIDLMKSSQQFENDLVHVEKQPNGEADIESSTSNKRYEIKTMWGQKGCAILAQMQNINKDDFNKMLEKIGVLQTLEEYSNYFDKKSTLYPDEITRKINKMKQKQSNCVFVLFYPLQHSPSISNIFPPYDDFDSKLWQNILIDNNLCTVIYTIKPNFENQFVLVRITKDNIADPIFFKHDDFFEKYYHFIN